MEPVASPWSSAPVTVRLKTESSFLHVLLFQAALRMHRELTQLVYRLEYFEQ